MQPLVFFFVVAAINVGGKLMNIKLLAKSEKSVKMSDVVAMSLMKDHICVWVSTEESACEVICQSQGGRLAEIPSFAANDFLTTIARHKRDLCVWFGGSDIIQEGVWEWSSGLNSFYSFRNWHSGEPNSDKNTEEDCLNMLQPLNYNWNDAPCNFNCNFICTKPAREAPSHAA